MIDRSDVGARLRLFRYGVVVVVVMTFIITLLYPYVALRSVPGFSATDFLGSAVLYTIAVAVLGAIAYIAYAYFLTKKFPWAK